MDHFQHRGELIKYLGITASPTKEFLSFFFFKANRDAKEALSYKRWKNCIRTDISDYTEAGLEASERAEITALHASVEFTVKNGMFVLAAF